MFRWMVLLMVLIPALEIWILLETGRLIGGWQTFALIVIMGFAGAYLAKREGRRVLEYARVELSRGIVPTSSILDGICIFAGGLLMLTPGFLTDAVGIVLVFPGTRFIFKSALLKFIKRKIDRGELRFYR
ncbi:FxsA family protein [Paenibacillus sp.]|uniref:FxsA family protein n=1 Tax=Paenibacillus sp. TaxID=58172 RepID=UPI002811B22A|nr:FxsA family protein [Paenibacillus sp.]